MGRALVEEAQLRAWIADGLQLTNIHGRLTCRGVDVPYRTLHRFAVERCGFGRRQLTLRVADGEPRVVHALIFTAVYSRHMFVWLSCTQTQAARRRLTWR